MLARARARARTHARTHTEYCHAGCFVTIYNFVNPLNTGAYCT